MATALKVTRPNRLTNDETLTSFEDWRNNVIFYLTQDKDFAGLLKETTKWTKVSDGDPNRGLASDAARQILDRFLGIIAGLAPPLLYHEIIDDTTCMSDVYRLLRSYYQFSPSESTFIKYYSIRRDVVNGSLERPLHLFLRMKQYIRDNLLLSSGKIEHDGKIPTKSETLSPTTERLVVLRWLEVLHPQLPHHVSNVFSQDLQSKSLKDLQPRICEQIDDLLRQVEDRAENDNLSASYSKFSRNSNPRNQYQHDSYKKSFKQQPPFQKQRSHTLPNNFNQSKTPRLKTCEACKMLNLPFVGHSIHSCRNISPDDRAEVLKACAIELESNDNDEEEEQCEDGSDEDNEDQYEEIICTPNEMRNTEVIQTQRVCVMRSPAFCVKICHVDASAVMDTGSTGNMIQLDIVEMANIRVYPTSHTAEQADGYSNLQVVGEIHTNITIDDDLTLPLSAVVVRSLKEDMLLGTPFMKKNKITIDFGTDSIRVRNREICFKDIIRKPRKSLLKASVSRVVFPGESVEFGIPANFKNDNEIAIEPRDNLSWPSPQIVSTTDGKMEVSNDTDFPVKIQRQQVIAQLRSVMSPEKKEIDCCSTTTIKPSTVKVGVETVQVDPNNILSQKQKNDFVMLNRDFARTFFSTN